MKRVMPIRDKEKVREIKAYLKKKNERDYILFMIGINAGLRVSDILPLRVRDVRGEYIEVIEQKTAKLRQIPINSSLKSALNVYVRGKKDNDYLIKSREGMNQPIGRWTAWKIIKDAGVEVGLLNLGTHSMRKTFGYNYYRRTKDIQTLCKMLGHSDEEITKRYIGIEDDFIREQYLKHTNL
ncbi:site-specific integrase [Sporosarcina sp. FSL K6-1508]|uniref:site-specific integrase n=1 Tax=Sporosarcina sp. FSL K6-1508 TaxID=2921553 RepID=UPI0030F4B824